MNAKWIRLALGSFLFIAVAFGARPVSARTTTRASGSERSTWAWIAVAAVPTGSPSRTDLADTLAAQRVGLQRPPLADGVDEDAEGVLAAGAHERRLPDRRPAQRNDSAVVRHPVSSCSSSATPRSASTIRRARSSAEAHRSSSISRSSARPSGRAP